MIYIIMIHMQCTVHLFELCGIKTATLPSPFTHAHNKHKSALQNITEGRERQTLLVLYTLTF